MKKKAARQQPAPNTEVEAEVEVVNEKKSGLKKVKFEDERWKSGHLKRKLSRKRIKSTVINSTDDEYSAVHEV